MSNATTNTIRTAATHAGDTWRGYRGTDRAIVALRDARSFFDTVEGREPTTEEGAELSAWTITALND